MQLFTDAQMSKGLGFNDRLVFDGSALCSWYIDRYLPQDSSLKSETVHFKRGVCQQFCLPSHSVNLSEWSDEEVRFCQEHLYLRTFKCEGAFLHLDRCLVLLTYFIISSSVGSKIYLCHLVTLLQWWKIY